MSGPSPSWYVAEISLYCIDADPLRDDWPDESISEVVHHKGSNSNAYHANGFGAPVWEKEVRVHEDDYQALRALRQTSVLWVRLSDNEQRTAVLDQFEARRVKGKCWYQGAIRLVQV